MSACKKLVRTEMRKGMVEEETRVICEKHGDVDKVRTPAEVGRVWEKHENDVKRGKV